MRTIMLKFEEVTRRRRPMQAIQVSVDNAQEIADWCGGEMVMSTIRMMGSETKLPAVRLNRPSTGGKDYTTALVTMWIVEFPDRFQVFKNDQYEKLFEPVSPKNPKWVEGLPVRVTRLTHIFAGWTGEITAVLGAAIEVRFPNGKTYGFGPDDLEITNEVPVRARPVIGTLDCPIVIVPGDAVSHNLGYDLVLPSSVITQVGFSGEGAPLPTAPAKVWENGDIVPRDNVPLDPHADGASGPEAWPRTVKKMSHHTVDVAALGYFEHQTEKGKHTLEIDPFAEPPNPTPAGESLVFKVDDRVRVIDRDSEWFEWDGTVMIGNTEDSTAVGVAFMDDVQEYRGFHPTQLKLLVREDKGEVVYDESENTPVVEYRCSKCDQIGGDSENGPYDGCPEGGKHNTDGGEV
jgi:hypothetical protein